MRTLKTEFNTQGHFLRQIWRGADVAIYERSLSPEHPAHELELISIKSKPQFKAPSGAIIPKRESYPSKSVWGTLGWSFPIRYKEWVLDLGQKLIAITKNRGRFVRQASHQLWLERRV